MRSRSLLLAFALAALFALPAASAQATQFLVGSPLSGSFGGGACSGPSGTWLNTAVSSTSATLTAPVSGAVVRWRLTGAYNAKSFNLRVLRPASGGKYAAVGASAPVSPAKGSGLISFETAIPIQAGDVIAVDVHEGCLGSAAPAGVHDVNWNPVLAEGGSPVSPQYGPFNTEIGYDAYVQPAPTISSITPASGSIAGGAAVTISGANFEGATAISFGAVPASFNRESSTQIQATVPAGVAGPATVTVTTPAGTASVPFTYLGAPAPLPVAQCVVPKLAGKKLKAAKKKLKAGDCKVGEVKKHKGVTAADGKVVHQSAKAGAKLAAGTKVKLTLG